MIPPTLARIHQRIQAFIAEITAIAEEAVREEVAQQRAKREVRNRRAGAKPPRGKQKRVGVGPGRRRGRSTAGAETPGGKRSADQLERQMEDLLEVIQLNPGERMESLGKLLGLPTKNLTLPMKRLIANRSVRTTGQKRATAYWSR